MDYGPLQYDFRMRDLERHLSSDALRRVRSLWFVKGWDDLVGNHVRPSCGSARPSGGRRAEGPALRPEPVGRAIATGFQDRIGSRMRSRQNRHRVADSRGLRMALDVFPNRHLCEGVQAEPLALAEESYRREFRLAKNRDDPIQTNTAGRGINSGYMNLCGRTPPRQ